MAIKYGFFNSVNGDRKYNADDISNYFLKLISNGVFATPADAMQVQAGTGMTVSVSAGWGFINCKWINNDSPYNLTLDASDVVLNRIDRVVLRLNASSVSRNVTIAIKKGSTAAEPVAPSLTRVSGGIWELSLARIYVSAGATEITQSAITDERADTSLCGWVTGLIDQIDTTNLFAQYNTAFNEWFSTIKETLSTTTLIRQYTSSYTTTAENETEIPINISVYNDALDVLNVYINGMKLIQGVDYTKNTTSVTLDKPLDVVGTSIEFEVLKSIDGSEAESVIDIVYQLQQEIGKSDRNVYFCNGINDNVGLMNYITEWERGQTTKDTIQIVGTFGCNSQTVTAADGKEYAFKYECTRGCGVTLDFSGCDVVDAPAVNFAYFSGCKVTGLNVMYSDVVESADIYTINAKDATIEKCFIHGTIGGTNTVFCYFGNNARFLECDANLTAAGSIWGIRGDIVDVDFCKINVTTTGANSGAYGIFISPSSHCSNSWFDATATGAGSTARAGHNGGQFVNCRFIGKGGKAGVGFFIGSTSILCATNCIFRGYTKNSGQTGAAGDGLNGAGTAFLNSIICNLSTVQGYEQTGSMYSANIKGSYSGAFYKEPNIPTGDTFVSNGYTIANILD